MNRPDTDVISTLAALRPEPPADAEQIRQRARRRLEEALIAAEPSRPGRPAWHRRRLVVGTTAAAAAAAAAIAVPAVLPGGAGPLVSKAWAVTRSDGAITVMIRKALRDQAGLQWALRADGVPAYVRSLSRCTVWEPQGGLSQIRRNDSRALMFPAPGNNDHDFRKITIHPAALAKGDAVFIGGGAIPGGWSLQLFVMRNSHPPVCKSHAPRITRVGGGSATRS